MESDIQVTVSSAVCFLAFIVGVIIAIIKPIKKKNDKLRRMRMKTPLLDETSGLIPMNALLGREVNFFDLKSDFFGEVSLVQLVDVYRLDFHPFDVILFYIWSRDLNNNIINGKKSSFDNVLYSSPKSRMFKEWREILFFEDKYTLKSVFGNDIATLVVPGGEGVVEIDESGNKYRFDVDTVGLNVSIESPFGRINWRLDTGFLDPVSYN